MRQFVFSATLVGIPRGSNLDICKEKFNLTTTTSIENDSRTGNNNQLSLMPILQISKG
jgi:hypothetical protein